MTENDQTFRSLISKYICSARTMEATASSTSAGVASGRMEVAATTTMAATATAPPLKAEAPVRQQQQQQTFFMCIILYMYEIQLFYTQNHTTQNARCVHVQIFCIFPYKVRHNRQEY